MEATEQYSPVVLFITLYKVILTFESVDEILKCDHSNGSYWAVLSCGAVYYAVQDGSNFWVCKRNPIVWPFKWKLLSSTFLWYCLLCYTRWLYLLKWKSNESYWAVLYFGASYYAAVKCDQYDELLSNNFFLWFSEILGVLSEINVNCHCICSRKRKTVWNGW